MSEICAGCGRGGVALLPGAPCWCPMAESQKKELETVAELAAIICAHGNISSIGMQELLEWMALREPVASPPTEQEREEFFSTVRDVQYRGMVTGTFEQGFIWDAVLAIISRSCK